MSPTDLLGALRAAITIADEDYRIVFMNDLAAARYADEGGAALVGSDLLACHDAASQEMIRQMYARHRAGDLTPIRYHVDKGDGVYREVLLMPLAEAGEFRGVAELVWSEHVDLVFTGAVAGQMAAGD